MTKSDYERIENVILNSVEGSALFRWELVKVLWEIRDALKGNLE